MSALCQHPWRSTWALEMVEPFRCMFDTVAFNRVVEGGISPEELADFIEVYATNIQRKEIDATRDPEKREKLGKVFRNLISASEATDNGPLLFTESMVWDECEWGSAKWSGNDTLYDDIKTALDVLDKKSEKANIRDALIAETAIKNGLTLVTDDKKLTEVAMQHGGECMYVELLFQLRRK